MMKYQKYKPLRWEERVNLEFAFGDCNEEANEDYTYSVPTNLEGPTITALAYAMGNEASFFAFPTYARLVKLL